jgi:hypothetical protein
MVGEKLGEHDINPFLEVDFRQIKIFTMEDLKIFFVETIHPEMREAVRKTKRYFEDHFGTLVQSVDFPLAHHMFEIWGALGYSERTAVSESLYFCK